MGIHMVFYFTLQLPWMIGAANSDGCSETCGGVTIPYPFGIKTDCYNNSWFRVTCNETADGPKPFIPSINLELLDTGYYGDSIVLVNNPVTYLNCGDEGNNGTTSASSLDLHGTPFFFPSNWNSFGSVGCSYLAAAFRSNQTEAVGTCLQPRCGHQLTDNFSGCHTPISEDLTSLMVSVTEVNNPGSKRCTSAFISYIELLTSHVSIDTTHVPALIKWNPCDFGGQRCQESLPYYGACTTTCGDVQIPDLFGIEAGCYMNEWFRVTCNETIDWPKIYVSSINKQLINVSIPDGTVLVNNSISSFNCLKKDGENNGVSVDLTGTPFLISAEYNRFMSVGCGSVATFLRSPTDEYPVGGCMQPICAGSVTSDISCSTDLPSDLSSFAINMREIYPSNASSGSSCGSAFIADQRSLDSIEMKISYRSDTSDRMLTHVPITLRWATRKRGFCRVAGCSLDDQYCWERISPTYLCVCTLHGPGDGNPYLSGPFIHESDQCDSTTIYRYCYMLCLNAPGNNCSSPSSCPDGYEYSNETDMCTNIFDESEFRTKGSKRWKNFPVIIGCSTCIGTVFALLGTWYLYQVSERMKDVKLKQKYFKRNGGLLLQQQLSSNEGNIEKIKFFASKELEKATDYYNENRILGRGGQGIVFKGMLTDGNIAAIKKPKLVEEKVSEELKLEQFMNEVIILSEINHRNVVKLLGCCLETEVPLLVYEFIPNGTLYNMIHEPNEDFPLTWEMRLRIATETANALSYLHSAASVPIYHRDVKSTNILLDDKYRAKVSDFGTSRSVALEQTHVTTRVQGTFGYLDPEYFRSSQFTEKSDVYSFGVVLVELLTGQKPVSSVQSEEEARSLVAFFLLKMQNDSLFDILDQIVMFGPEEEIEEFANLAKRCLNLNGKDRPTMRQVAHELERIRSSEETDVVEQCVDEDPDMDDITEASTSDARSTSGLILNDSVTLTFDA